MKKITACFILILFILITGNHSAIATPNPVTINFDTISSGIVLPANQYSQASFYGPSGVYGSTIYVVSDYQLNGSYPNGIVSGYNNCTPGSACAPGELYIDFPIPVNNFSFRFLNSVINNYPQLTIDVYVNYYYYGTFYAYGNGQPYIPNQYNGLSSISNITGIRIFASNVDYYGYQHDLYYDDFSFKPSFDVNITSGRVPGILNGTTQNALLGADVSLNASVNPSSLSGGTYSWSVTGPNQQVTATNTSSSYTVRWTDTGTYQATVTYSRNRFTATSTINVNVIAPTFDSLTGAQYDTFVNNGCVGTYSQYDLGCVARGLPGITFNSTVHIPSGQYLTDLSQSGVKYVQRVSGFRKQLNGGVIKCRTRRTSEADNNSGWLLDSNDGSETYDIRATALRHFSEGASLTITTEDVPGEVLEGSLVQGLAYPFDPPPGLNDNHQHDAFKVDDYFEMYVVYFTTTSPSIKRTLGKLSWNWGGIVVYDARNNPVPYRETAVFGVSGFKTGYSSDQSITYQGFTGDPNFVMGTCPGSPPPNPSSVDSARFFTTQQYWDILNRQPDGAWLIWANFITSCGFDQTCINNVRIGNVRGFFESPEFRATHPGFDNPGSNEYNTNYVKALYETLLRRPPDGAWTAWLDYINQTGDYNGLVGGFINSVEYRDRLNSFWPSHF